MKVLIVSRGIPTKQNPLLGSFEWDQAKALCKAGHRVTFFALDLRSIRRKRSFGIFQRETDGMRIFVHSLPVGAIPPALFVKAGERVLLSLYKRAFRAGDRPDVVHAHFTDMGCIASVLKRKKSLPLVITEHSSIMGREEVPESTLRMAKKGYAAADCLIAVSGELSAKILQHTGMESRVIQNIIDPEVFLKCPKQEHTGFRFISVSNLIPRKRIGLLIDAFARVRRNAPEACLDIVGDGEERAMLEEKVTSYGLTDAVSFAGGLPRPEVAEHLAAADAFVLPSELETFGVVYAEAMMAGLPVIATTCGGPQDFVKDFTGLLGAYDTEETLAEAMEQMLRTKDAYDTARIRDYAVASFSPSVIAAQLTEVYEKCAVVPET